MFRMHLLLPWAVLFPFVGLRPCIKLHQPILQAAIQGTTSKRRCVVVGLISESRALAVAILSLACHAPILPVSFSALLWLTVLHALREA